MGTPQLNIKDAEATRLARELAELTGETQTEAVRRSLAERLEREKTERAADAGRSAEARRREFERVWPRFRKFRQRFARSALQTRASRITTFMTKTDYPSDQRGGDH